MPCYSITTIGINTLKLSPRTLENALKSDGATVTVDGEFLRFRNHPELGCGWVNTKTGELNVSMSRRSEDELKATLKRSYAGETLRQVAKAKGWRLNKTADNKFQMQTRSY